jgi:hypothetical protein
MSRGRTQRSSIELALLCTAACIAIPAAAVLIAIVPWPISFGIAVSGAVAWCRWLERHPDAPAAETSSG